MKTASFNYRVETGWQEFPELDSPSTLLFVTGETRFVDDPAVFAELREAFPESKIVGSSSSGGIFGGELLEDALAVGVAKFEKSSIALKSAHITPETDSFDTGLELARGLVELATEEEPLAAVYLVSNGIHANGSRLVAGVNSVVDEGVVVTGALAGDGERFERTWVLDGADARLDRTVAVGLYGQHLVTTHGSKGGWDRFGIERKITRSEGNVLYELDGKPALDLYKRYLGEHASGLPETALLFPLQIRAPDGSGRPIVRTILAVDHDENSMTFAGDMPSGWSTQLMKANFGRIVDGAEEAARMAAEMEPHAGPSFAVAVSCIGRKIVLQNYVRDELTAVEETLPDESLMIGLYSYGEISPMEKGGRCDLHNQTMTVTLWSER